MPFGDFMNDVPSAVFLVIHTVLGILGIYLWRKVGATGRAAVANALLWYVAAEVLYLIYHLEIIGFLLSHTLAEVCDALAILGLTKGLIGKPA
jgi:hypothetical protein